MDNISITASDLGERDDDADDPMAPADLERGGAHRPATASSSGSLWQRARDPWADSVMNPSLRPMLMRDMAPVPPRVPPTVVAALSAASQFHDSGRLYDALQRYAEAVSIWQAHPYVCGGVVVTASILTLRPARPYQGRAALTGLYGIYGL